MSLSHFDRPGQPAAQILLVRVDRRTVQHSDVPYRPDGVDLDVDLTGADELEIATERTGKDPSDAWTHVADVRIESIP